VYQTLTHSRLGLLHLPRSGTKPAKAGIMHRTIEPSIIKGLIKRAHRTRLRRQHFEGVAGMWRFTAATST
jgi:hypothetical protein